MRWKAKGRIPHGTRKIVKRFLIFPRRLRGEWRWLETAYIAKEYDHKAQYIGEGSYTAGWISLDWAAKENYLGNK